MARKGLPAKYAKMGFKKGWKAYKASKRKTKRKSSSSSKTKKGGNRVAKNSFGFSTIAKYLKLGSLIGTGVLYAGKRSGSMGNKVGRTLLAYGGVDTSDKFNIRLVAQMWGPFILTNLLTVGIGKMNGIIRRL